MGSLARRLAEAHARSVEGEFGNDHGGQGDGGGLEGDGQDGQAVLAGGSAVDALPTVAGVQQLKKGSGLAR